MKKNITIKTLLGIAESFGWKITPVGFEDSSTGYLLCTLSPYGLELRVELPDSDTDGKESPEVLLNELRKYCYSYNPEQEALLWIGPDAKGRCGAPETLTDVIKDMNGCKRKIQKLLDAWESATGHKQDKTDNSFTVYRIVRIDAEYNPEKTSADDALETAVSKVFSDARAHMHTIESGVRITGIADCGESI